MLLFLVSISPFALFLYLLLWKKLSLLWVSFLTCFFVFVLTAFLWQILPGLLYISFVKGFLIAFDIFIIIFGAIFFLQILKSLKIIDNIGLFLESFSKDYRVQVILLAWFLENFLEGTAGFGTPAAVVAPILLALGLPPLSAVIISLLGNSTAGVFGAAGTPIRVGFAGMNISSIPTYTAAINCIGFLVPVFMIWTLASYQKDRKSHFWEVFPFAVWAGIAFVVPSYIVVGLGQEFPSILGAIIGLILVYITTRLGLFMPKNIRRLNEKSGEKATVPFYKIVIPYLLLILLLILGKLLIGTKGITLSFVKHTISFYNPGYAFIIAGLPVAFFWSKQKSLIIDSAKTALKRSIGPFLVIVLLSTMTQLMLNSGQNISGFLSSLEIIAQKFETASLPFWSPFIGAFGSFITGSVTVSNIMFGNFLLIAGKALSLNTDKVLALEVVGAAAGNMIALADMLAAQAIIGLRNKERQILKGVIIPCLIYVVLTGLIGLLIVKK